MSDKGKRTEVLVVLVSSIVNKDTYLKELHLRELLNNSSKTGCMMEVVFIRKERKTNLGIVIDWSYKGGIPNYISPELEDELEDKYNEFQLWIDGVGQGTQGITELHTIFEDKKEENCTECKGTGRRDSGSQEFEGCTECRGTGLVDENEEEKVEKGYQVASVRLFTEKEVISILKAKAKWDRDQIPGQVSGLNEKEWLKNYLNKS